MGEAIAWTLAGFAVVVTVGCRVAHALIMRSIRRSVDQAIEDLDRLSAQSGCPLVTDGGEGGAG
jgi:2-methylisocitrate lyase-like PEP mutase family enzyme